MAMKESTKALINFLKENASKDMTAADVAEALGIEKKSVDGSFTQGIQKKGFGYREEAEVENADGSHTKVKFLKLNEDGMAFDPNADAE